MPILMDPIYVKKKKKILENEYVCEDTHWDRMTSCLRYIPAWCQVSLFYHFKSVTDHWMNQCRKKVVYSLVKWLAN